MNSYLDKDLDEDDDKFAVHGMGNNRKRDRKKSVKNAKRVTNRDVEEMLADDQKFERR